MAVGVTFLVIRFTGDDTPVASDPNPASTGTTDTDPDEGEAGDAPDSEASATPTPSETERPEQPRVDCWSGRVRRSVAACGRPTGVAGLEWVFPDFSRTACTEQDARRKQMWVCSASTDDGTRVLVRYSEYTPREVRSTFTRLNNKWASHTNDNPAFGSSDTRYIWRYNSVLDNEYPYVISWMYANHPFSVSIEGDTSADIEEVLATQRWRHPDDMRGTVR